MSVEEPEGVAVAPAASMSPTEASAEEGKEECGVVEEGEVTAVEAAGISTIPWEEVAAEAVPSSRHPPRM